MWLATIRSNQIRGGRTMKQTVHALLIGSSLGAVSMAPATAQPANEPAAQSGLEEILVTARRRSESLDRVPISVSVLDAATLASRGGFTPTSFNETVPGPR